MLCKTCQVEIPDWFAEIYKGRCMNCHVASVCVYCKKPKVPIGVSRRGGKQSQCDWDDRMYHKKCWLFLKKIGQLP
jgi:hypothetical protein